ncbi:unnamed protein product [Closterium sp. NIES-53]
MDQDWSGHVAAESCDCRSLTHPSVLWHHCLDHPSFPRLSWMVRHRLVSGLPASLAPFPRSPAPPGTPCVKGRQRAAPHSSSFPPTTAPFQTLHSDIWGPSAANVLTVLKPWLLAWGGAQGMCGLRLHSDHGGEFSSTCMETFYQGRGIIHSYMLPALPQQNGVAKRRRIGLVMKVSWTSMCHAGAPQFLWPQAVRYAAHQLNLWPSDARPWVTSVILWKRSLGVAADFRVWGSLAHVRAPGADKLSPHTCACIFLGFPLDVAGWVFYDPLTYEFFCSQDVTPPQPLAMEPVVVLAGGTGGTGGVGGGGAGSGGAGAGGTGTVAPTPHAVHFLTHKQRLLWLEREEHERFERARQQQQQQQQEQSQSQLQESVEEESPPQQERLVQESRSQQEVQLHSQQDRVEEDSLP